MIAGIEMMSCPNLSVPAEVMQHIVNVESGKNPYAIGVVGGQLVRQPQNMDEAIATAQMLESKGYNYSLGISQVNRNNLGKYGLDSYDKAFSVCSNLAAGSQILAECYNSSGGDWGKAFSCYYSGNFVTGYRTGYVQKVFNSINRTAMLASNGGQAKPIQLADQSYNQRATPLPNANGAARVQIPTTPNSAAYRVAIRSSLIDTALNSLVSPAVAAAADVDPAAAQAAAQLQGATQPQGQAQAPTAPNSSLQRMMQQVQQTNYGNQPQAQASGTQLQQMMQQVQQANYGPAQPQGAQDQAVSPAVSQQQAAATAAAPASSNDVFEPQVRGPNDPVQAPAQAGPPQAAPAQQAAPVADQADLRQGNGDGAFVF